MTREKLNKLEGWLEKKGYVKWNDSPAFKEEYRWDRAKYVNGDWQYISQYLVYDFEKFGGSFADSPIFVQHHIIAKSDKRDEYHLKYSLAFGKKHLDKAEKLIEKFYNFMKDK